MTIERLNVKPYKELLRSINETEKDIILISKKREDIKLLFEKSQELITASKKRKEECLCLFALDKIDKAKLDEANKALMDAEIHARDLENTGAVFDQEIKNLSLNKRTLQSTLQDTQKLLWRDVLEILKQRIYVEAGDDFRKAFVAYFTYIRGSPEMFSKDIFKDLFGKWGPTNEQIKTLKENIEKEYFQ